MTETSAPVSTRDDLCPDCGHHLHRPNPGPCGWRDCKCGAAQRPPDAALEQPVCAVHRMEWEHPDHKRDKGCQYILVPAAPAAEGLREALDLLREVRERWDAGDVDSNYDAIASTFDSIREYLYANDPVTRARLAGEDSK